VILLIIGVSALSAVLMLGHCGTALGARRVMALLSIGTMTEQDTETGEPLQRERRHQVTAGPVGSPPSPGLPHLGHPGPGRRPQEPAPQPVPVRPGSSSPPAATNPPHPGQTPQQPGPAAYSPYTPPRHPLHPLTQIPPVPDGLSPPGRVLAAANAGRPRAEGPSSEATRGRRQVASTPRPHSWQANF
jgi:hypothetical protein